jgi:hypothetical protein
VGLSGLGRFTGVCGLGDGSLESILDGEFETEGALSLSDESPSFDLAM